MKGYVIEKTNARELAMGLPDPYRWTGKMRKGWLFWYWSLEGNDGYVAGRGKRLSHDKARRDLHKLMSYATTA